MQGCQGLGGEVGVLGWGQAGLEDQDQGVRAVLRRETRWMQKRHPSGSVPMEGREKGRPRGFWGVGGYTIALWTGSGPPRYTPGGSQLISQYQTLQQDGPTAPPAARTREAPRGRSEGRRKEGGRTGCWNNTVTHQRGWGIGVGDSKEVRNSTQSRFSRKGAAGRSRLEVHISD